MDYDKYVNKNFTKIEAMNSKEKLEFLLNEIFFYKEKLNEINAEMENVIKILVFLNGYLSRMRLLGYKRSLKENK